jgi:NAD/NADP octopine/nopaline dehydrogenase
MKFTIIGCGNAGLIHAAKLCEKGIPVGVLKSSNVSNNDFFDIIQQEGCYLVKDDTNNGNRFYAKPEFITKDVQLAIEFADVIMVMTTTAQHEYVAKLIAPFVRDGQIITLIPGYMGSLIFKKYIDKDIIYSEWETTAYNGRIVDSMYVHITFYNPRNAISTMPTTESSRVLDIFKKCFRNTKYARKHILESALHNPNMIVHPIGLLFSASRIEFSKGEFWMYREAFTPSVINVIKELDIQKNKILNAFGCNSLDYFDAAKWRNEEDLSQDAMEVFKSFANSSNKGPSFINHRYIREDVPIGLGLFSSIGKVVGVDTSIPEAITSLASALLRRNLRSETRTIQQLLNTENVTIEEIKKAIE